MSAAGEMKRDKIFTPEMATMKAASVGPIMILTVSIFLAALGLATHFFPSHDYATKSADLIPLAILMLLVGAMAIVPLRQLRYRRALLKDGADGHYRITIDPQAITVETRTDRKTYGFRDFSMVCSDGDFLGNTRDFGGLVLSRTTHDKPFWKQRASIVNAIRSGRVAPVNHDGLITIPLTYFGRTGFLDIIATAREYHQNAPRRQGG
ncbi:hypothetical protein SAMN05444414_102249 [Roseovarius marisflavi]|uniref:Uncharacterized protein n=2 Tax=Roseovarius marisflavi TaxID=1054996 RepID=A0A1M6WCN9_9RHOB|nr:hypothetical protein SAMN05444414_102249 [Roseovarius marisflavi]